MAFGGSISRKELNTDDRPPGWFHMVLVLQGEDIRVYQNKVTLTETVNSIDRTSNIPFIPGSGTTVIGKKNTDKNRNFASVIVDELAMWNHALTEAEVAQIYDIVSE